MKPSRRKQVRGKGANRDYCAKASQQPRHGPADLLPLLEWLRDYESGNEAGSVTPISTVMLCRAVADDDCQ